MSPMLSKLIILVLVATTGAALAQSERQVPRSAGEITLSFAPVVERTAPAVVNIYAKRMVRQRANPLLDDPFFRRFFGGAFGGRQQQREVPSLGSGVILDPAGLIVTNAHVIEGADEITVVLSDRREFEAEVRLSDPETDLAVLQIRAPDEKLPFLQFRDADTLKVGDLVLAIGNPFGVGQTVTSGIVSGLARNRVTDSGGPQSFIQTDAAINPGNSGGALVTLDGLLAGINTAIFTRSGGSHGVGFAIPSSLVKAVVDGARTGRGIVRAWIGMSGQELTSDLADGLGLDRPAGVLVSDIHPGGPAERAGIRSGDVIVSFDGKAVMSPSDFQFRLATRSVGQAVPLGLWRKGNDVAVNLPLEVAPEIPLRNVTALTALHPLQGIEVANLSPALAEEVNYVGVAQGVIILRAARGSQATRFGARAGHVIVEVNGQRVSRAREVEAMLLDVHDSWVINMRRPNGSSYQIKASRG
jgi:Do/DeqQ family serine protease